MRFQGSVSGFRTLGTGATPHNLLSIENTANSPVSVKVNRITVQLDATAVLTAVMLQVKLSRATAIPTGGTELTKVALDPGLSSASNVIIRSATASDGGTATEITATAGATIWQKFLMRMHTLVGQVLGIDFDLLPAPIILKANQAVLVQVTGTAGSNPNTNHWIVNVSWEEMAP